MATIRGRVLVLMAVLVLVGVASCAYFNTFWMAKNEYKDALKGGGFDFSDPYTQPQLRGEPAKLVDSCIERCGKILLLHSESGLVDDALLMMGNCFVLKGEYEDALRKYEELLDLFPSSDLVYEAKYMKAYTLVRQGESEQAVPILEGLASQTKDEKIEEKAAYLTARIYHHDGDCDRAIENFNAYLEKFKKSKQAGQARLALASCLVKSDMAEEAVKILEPMAGTVDAEGVAAALGMGIAYRTLGDYDRSLEVLSGIAYNVAEDSVAARAEIEMAQTLVNKGEYEAAVDALGEAAEKTKQTAPLVSAEAVYKQGLVYEKQLTDRDKAIETYASISQQKSDYALLAKKRHGALTTLRTYRQAMNDSIPDTPEQVAEDLFMMSEILIEDLGREEEARQYLKTVADSIPQTDFGAKAALRFAALLEAKGDTLARVYQRKVIELFPNTVYANVAREQLGLALEDVIVKKPEPAEADSALADSTAAAAAAIGPALPDSLLPGGPEVRPTRPEPSAASPDSAWASRRQARPASRREGAVSAKSQLRPPPIVPTGQDSTGSGDLGPGQEPGSQDQPGSQGEPGSQDQPETPVPGEETVVPPPPAGPPVEPPIDQEPAPADSSGAPESSGAPDSSGTPDSSRAGGGSGVGDQEGPDQ